MTCDKASQKCWQVDRILKRQLIQLTSTRGCLTSVLLLSALQDHKGLNMHVQYHVKKKKNKPQPHNSPAQPAVYISIKYLIVCEGSHS